MKFATVAFLAYGAVFAASAAGAEISKHCYGWGTAFIALGVLNLFILVQLLRSEKD